MKKSSTIKSPPAAKAGIPVAHLTADNYEPRRSNKVSADLAQADGETWHERLAVCEGATPQGTPRLLVRTYFRNKRTGQRVWDEPPSGASNIKFAPPEDRKQADAQLSELRVTLDMIPPEEEIEDANGSSKAKKMRGLLRFFRRKRKAENHINDAQDLNLQRAIARSMADQGGYGGCDEPVIFYDSGNNQEDLAVAKALSMSDSAGNNHLQHQMSEEEMLQFAIEESKREVERNDSAPPAGTLSLPTTCSYAGITEELMHCLDLDPDDVHSSYNNNHMNQKMPATMNGAPYYGHHQC